MTRDLEVVRVYRPRYIYMDFGRPKLTVLFLYDYRTFL